MHACPFPRPAHRSSARAAAQRHDALPSPARRTLLKLGGGLLAGTALAAPARRADASDFKALVCVFLYGGNDGLNTLVPTDDLRHAQYRDVRRQLALPRDRLLPLAGSDWGLHPALEPLQACWRDRRLAAVLNVGPLQAPLDKTALLAAPSNSPLVPEGLFSHSDQQAQWETASTSSQTRSGWAGRAVEALGLGQPVVSVGGNARYGNASRSSGLVVPEPGASFGAIELGSEAWRQTYAPAAARASAIRRLYAQAQATELGDVYARMQRDAFEVAARLGPVVQAQPGGDAAHAAVDAAFAPLMSGGIVQSGIGRQLYQAARLIARRDLVGGSRQLYFAQQGGYDTHSEQIGNDALSGAHANLLRDLGGAVAAFDRAMRGLGLDQAVTLFTQSDFGRAFKPNQSLGTDHAWGNLQFVLGGAVRGGRSYGTAPELALAGRDDVDHRPADAQGRWIPTTSVDQYAATLLGWLGATDAQLDAILPNLRSFGAARRLGFV